MEVIAFIWSLLFPDPVQPEGWPVSVASPAPIYPEELMRSEYTGKVRFYLPIGNDGIVRRIRIVESSHPELAGSVRQAVNQWRFEPWTVTQRQPVLVEVMLLVLFGRHDADLFSPEITIGLSEVRCAYLNQEVAHARRDYPLAPLSDVDVFAYTDEFLQSPFGRLNIPNPAERARLLGQMRGAIPATIAQCQAHPDRRYVDFLPDDIRQALSGMRVGDVPEDQG